jgi:hypothetical protein
MDRCPLTISRGVLSQKIEADDIADFNERIQELAQTTESELDDTKVFQFDSHLLFTNVLDNPLSYPQTSTYKDTINPCPNYAK